MSLVIMSNWLKKDEVKLHFLSGVRLSRLQACPGKFRKISTTREKPKIKSTSNSFLLSEVKAIVLFCARRFFVGNYF